MPPALVGGCRVGVMVGGGGVGEEADEALGVLGRDMVATRWEW